MGISAQDWVDLHQLVTRYSRGLDSRDYDLVRSVWAPDAQISYDLSTVGVDKALLTYSSGEQMAEDAEHIHAPLLATMHQNHNHYFEVDGDDATGRVYVDLFEVRIDADRPQTVHHLGWYDDRYVRTPEGWRVSHTGYRRTFEITYNLADLPGLKVNGPGEHTHV